MLELQAVGPFAGQAWKETLPLEGVLRLGRAPRHGLAVPWDALISREHADLSIVAGKLIVEQLPTAKCPIVQRGCAHTRLEVSAGESFSIGRTTFSVELARQVAEILHSRMISREESQAARFGGADERLELLSRLPDVLANLHSPKDLSEGIVKLLLTGVLPASAAAVVQEPDPDRPHGVIHSRERVPGQAFVPSRRLIQEALSEQQTRIHVWRHGADAELTFTHSNGLDWAICAPVRSKTRSPWGLYIAGSSEELTTAQASRLEASLLPEVRYMELLCRFLGAVYDLRTTEKRRATLSQFLSPAVVAMLNEDGSEGNLVATPREVTTLFCDLRGFSRAAETTASLVDLLQQVSAALGLVTQEILKLEGVIADFQGDSVLGFWGWPDADVDGPLAACRAGLAILNSFAKARQQCGDASPGFRLGIGIAFGTALAGRVGTKEQAKLGVFGPVVNLGSRLEGLTSAWGETILLNAEAVEMARPSLENEEAVFRRLGKFRLQGMSQPTAIYEMLPPGLAAERFSPVSLAQFESGQAAFESGDWSAASQYLEPLAAADPVARTILQFIHDRTSALPEWNGVLPMAFKRMEGTPLA